MAERSAQPFCAPFACGLRRGVARASGGGGDAGGVASVAAGQLLPDEAGEAPVAEPWGARDSRFCFTERGPQLTDKLAALQHFPSGAQRVPSQPT